LSPHGGRREDRVKQAESARRRRRGGSWLRRGQSAGMLEGMRKSLVTTTFFATAALLVASVALAATPKTNEYFQGNTAHKHYRVSITTGCTGKNCTNATSVKIEVRAGSATNPSAALCPYAAYDLPLAQVKQGKFSSGTQFTVGAHTQKFTVSGSFTAATTLKGTVTGVKACGGSDAFSLKGSPVKKVTVIGPTGKRG
jgi:hypothetical protein